MPILNVKISGEKDVKIAQAVHKMLLEETSKILKKKPEVTAIAIEFIDETCWFIGENSLADQNKKSFYFDIKITDETNSKEEKAKYIKATFEGFEKILGKLNPKSYVYVQDVRAAAYGYGGYTQEYRFHHPD